MIESKVEEPDDTDTDVKHIKSPYAVARCYSLAAESVDTIPDAHSSKVS